MFDLISSIFKVTVAALAIYVANHFFNIRKILFGNSKQDRIYPRLKGLPLLGNALQIVKTSWPVEGVSPNVYTLQSLMGCAKLFKNESVYQVQIGPVQIGVVFKASSVEKLLKSNVLLTKPYQYQFLNPWLGDGLITSGTSTWKKHRKMLTPSFHFKILDQFQPIMYEKSLILIDKLKKHVDSEAIDIVPFISLCTMDIICETAMGCNVNAQVVDSDYVNAMQDICLATFQRTMSLHLWPDLFFKMSKLGREYYKNIKIVHGFIENLIAERKAEFLANDQVDISNDEDDGPKKPKAFLNLLTLQHIQDGSLSLEDVKDEVNTFMFAGQDTTAVALIWSLFLLGLHPKVQDLVAQEIYEVFGDDCERTITNEDLKSLKYLDYVVKESQRLYPSVPLIARHLDEDLDIDGVILKKGSTCGALINALHYDSEVFPEPEQFRPERFFPENTNGRHPFAFVPFSAGPRNCVGQRFAILEEKTLLTSILRNFEVISVDHRDSIPVSPELVSRPTKPIRMQIKARRYP